MEGRVHPCIWQFESIGDFSEFFFNLEWANFFEVQFVVWPFGLDVLPEEIDLIPPLEVRCRLVPSIVVFGHHDSDVLEVKADGLVELL